MRLSTLALVAVAVVVLMAVGGLLTWFVLANRPGGYGYGMYGSGMMHDRGPVCPMCGGPWQNPSGWDGNVPDKLPKPQNAQWVTRLREILALEKLSLNQYSADEERFRVHMPYTMIIPQERDHIRWITELFEAYDLAIDGKVPQIKKTDSVTAAYQTGRNLEEELIPRYTWLIQNTGDDKTRQILDTIQFQTRMHYTMFTHALQMGGMGRGMGGGMRGGMGGRR